MKIAFRAIEGLVKILQIMKNLLDVHIQFQYYRTIKQKNIAQLYQSTDILYDANIIRILYHRSIFAWNPSYFCQCVIG